MSEAMWRKEAGVIPQSTPSMATYTEAMNKFTKAATEFMEHVHLLNEARDAYQTAMANSTALRNSLDTGDQALRALMTQMEQVASAHLRESGFERKRPEPFKPEASKVEAIRTNTESTGGKFLP
jgi:exonuclease VII small subunit